MDFESMRKYSNFCRSALLFTIGYHKISRDCKIAAIRLFEHHLLPLEDILDCCGFLEHTWYHILKLWNETGDVIKLGKTQHGILDKEDVQYLLRLVQQNPEYFLDELLHLLKTNCFISVHYSTIHCELEQVQRSSDTLH
jgi:hypothetical protein